MSNLLKISVNENSLSSMDFELSSSQRSALNSLRVSRNDGTSGQRVVDLVPASADNYFRIQARDVVGSVSVAGVDLDIIPKCGISQLDYMLNYAGSSVHVEPELVEMQTGDMREYFVDQFLSLFELATEEGSFEDYIPRSHIGMRPKGRIDFSWSGNGLPLPVRFSFDEFTRHNSLNEFIAAVLERIIVLFGADSVKGALAKNMAADLGVPGRVCSEDEFLLLLEIAPNSTYKQCLRIGHLILRADGVSPSLGDIFVPGILFRMSRVYEDFVSKIVQGKVDRMGFFCDLQGSAARRFLDRGKRISVKPDFSVWDESMSRCYFIGDVKYKMIDELPRVSDIYQALAYMKTMGTSESILFYIGDAEMRRMEIDSVDCGVSYIGLDLESTHGPSLVRRIEDAIEGKVLESTFLL